MTSLTDASSNTTSWVLDASGQVIEETITVNSTGLTRHFAYDAAGNLVEKVDRNGRVTRFTYDNLLRQTTEAWYDDLQDQTANLTYTTTYDTASRVASVSDGTTSLSYTYSIFGNLTSQTQSLDGLADDVVFDYRYDAAGRKTSVASKIGTTENYINEYDYDSLGRNVKLSQSGVSGGNAVAEKRVDFAYNDDNTRATITRYADLAGNDMVAATDEIFDQLGRIDSITHERAATVFADYDFTWDAANRITDLAMDFLGTANDDSVDYSYDDTAQLTGADYATQTDESYAYDDTGNRTLVDGTESYSTGDQNRLESDGTYYYTHDNEGNRTGKYSDAQCTVAVQKYYWDHRNRLVKIEVYDAGTLDQIVEYAYDYANRRYRRTLDANADQTIDARSIFVYDEVNNQIVLELSDDGVGGVTSSDVSKRLFYGTNIDQILAEEHIGDDTYWTLADHLNTIRDLVSYDSGVTALEQHNIFSSFGELLSTPTIETLLLYTARPFDYIALLQDNLNRPYDAPTGTWLTTDPIGFEAGDVNLYRYVGNASLRHSDPTGRMPTRTEAIDPEPVMDLELGFEFGLRRELALSGGTTVVDGMQQWQGNKVVSTFLVVEQDQTCKWYQSQNRILDVVNIGGMNYPVKSTDTISAYLGGTNAKNVIFFLQMAQKKSGFRTYQIDSNGKIVFTESKLPLCDNADGDRDATYEATDAEWTRAAKMSGPFLSGELRYVWADINALVCRCAAEVEKARAVYAASIGGELNVDDRGMVEVLRYKQSGADWRGWFAAGGRESTVD